MVKGLEKLLKTTRNIFLASAIGFTTLFIPQSNIVPQPIEYKQPPPSKPKLYTEIHSKFPEKQRKSIEYIFEDLMSKLLIYKKEDDIEKYLDTCEEIEDKYKEINLNDPEFPIDYKDVCYISEEDFDKFKRYGYFFDRNKHGNRHITYGKLDSEEEILDDSWKGIGKEPENRKVITYYSLPNAKNNQDKRIAYIKGPTIMEFNNGGRIISLGNNNDTIHIDMLQIEKSVDKFIENSIERIEYYDTECNIRAYLQYLKYDLENSFELDHIVLFEFNKIINSEHLSRRKRYCSSEESEYINKMKSNMINPNFRKNQIEEYKKSIFIHEANHFQVPYIYLENKLLKPLNKFLENPDEILPIEVTPEFNEFIAFLSQLANSPDHITLDLLTNIAIHSYKELNETPHKKAVNALVKLYSKKLDFPSEIRPHYFISGPALVFNHLKSFNPNNIKDLSKEIYKDVFLLCPTPKELSELLGHPEGSCLIKEENCQIK